MPQRVFDHHQREEGVEPDMASSLLHRQFPMLIRELQVGLKERCGSLDSQPSVGQRC